MFSCVKGFMVAVLLLATITSGACTLSSDGNEADELFVANEAVDAAEANGVKGQFTVQKISAEEAHDMMVSNETVVLDVRQPDEYAAGHIVNARLLPLDTITDATATEVAPDTSAPVLVYCRSGVRSAEAAKKLAALGYEQVYDFGGILDWPYDTVITDDETPQSGLSADQLPVGVKVVCGKTKSVPE